MKGVMKDPIYGLCPVCGKSVLVRKNDGLIAKHTAQSFMVLTSLNACPGSDHPAGTSPR
jgi:hypothetical protein